MKDRLTQEKEESEIRERRREGQASPMRAAEMVRVPLNRPSGSVGEDSSGHRALAMGRRESEAKGVCEARPFPPLFVHLSASVHRGRR
jgi:hypothetical protein